VTEASGSGEPGFVIEIESEWEDVLGKRIQVKSVVRCVEPGTR
jgi:hypothetical protein